MAKMHTYFLSLSLYFITTFAYSEEYEIGQLNKEFTTKKMTIKVGDKINFVNQDDFFHNVFSLSDAAMFDLGSYPKGESRSITFEEKGTVEVECAIHPNMRVVIEVE